jgi:electron transport complex protein RnfC
VLKGQLIAEADGFISAPIHSAVSGTVKAIENRLDINGSKPMSIVIENDGLDEAVDGFGTQRDANDLTCEQIIDVIKQAGIVGLGGAGFPTGVKLSPKNKDEIDTIIINGCECEPYLTVDYRVMLEKGEQIVKAVRQILRLFPNARAVFGIEDNKADSIKVIKGFIKPDDKMDIVSLKTKYPQGGERSLIYAVTGRKINSKMLPADAKCIVVNTSTCYAIYNALFENIPLITRFMTISGDGANQCNNFEVPIGIDHKTVASACGGFKDGVNKLISGGPMTGFALTTLDVPVKKTSSSILAFTKDEVEGIEQTNCIHCGKCVSVCPSNLIPQMMAKAIKVNNFDKFEQLGGMECVQCGCCSYSCPAKIPLTHMFRLGKAEVMKKYSKGKGE